MIILSLSRNSVDNNPNRCIMMCLSSDDRSQINLFSSDNNEKFLYVSFIFFIYGCAWIKLKVLKKTTVFS